MLFRSGVGGSMFFILSRKKRTIQSLHLQGLIISCKEKWLLKKPHTGKPYALGTFNET